MDWLGLDSNSGCIHSFGLHGTEMWKHVGTFLGVGGEGEGWEE